MKETMPILSKGKSLALCQLHLSASFPRFAFGVAHCYIEVGSLCNIFLCALYTCSVGFMSFPKQIAILGLDVMSLQVS
jgi:hypothetical protein